MMLYGKEMSKREVEILLRSANSRNEVHEILTALDIQRRLKAKKKIARETDSEKRYLMEKLFKEGIYDFSVIFGSDKGIFL